MRIMRTTVAIDDHLLAQARDQARRSGVSLGAVIEDALRMQFARVAPDSAPEIPVFAGTGVHPGVDLTSNRALRDLLDEGTELDQRR